MLLGSFLSPLHVLRRARQLTKDCLPTTQYGSPQLTCHIVHMCTRTQDLTHPLLPCTYRIFCLKEGEFAESASASMSGQLHQLCTALLITTASCHSLHLARTQLRADAAG